MRKFLAPALIIVSMLLISLPLFFQRFSFNKICDPGRKIISTQPQKVSSRKLDESTFTNSGYIIPLENNATGSIYSSKAQIRGVIKKWDKLSALIIVGKEEKTVWIPSEIRAYCFPRTMTDAKGKEVDSREIYLDFTNWNAIGTKILSSNLQNMIPVKSDVTILVNIGEKDVMTAFLAVGYGCTIAGEQK